MIRSQVEFEIGWFSGWERLGAVRTGGEKQGRLSWARQGQSKLR